MGNEANTITKEIIRAAIEVHKHLGPGLLESIYEKALCYELGIAGLAYKSQVEIPVIYKGMDLGGIYRMDLLVEDAIVVELKAVERIEPVFKAQLLSYLKNADKRLGLLINFNVPKLVDGITRIINS